MLSRSDQTKTPSPGSITSANSWAPHTLVLVIIIISSHKYRSCRDYHLFWLTIIQVIPGNPYDQQRKENCIEIYDRMILNTLEEKCLCDFFGRIRCKLLAASCRWMQQSINIERHILSITLSWWFQIVGFPLTHDEEQLIDVSFVRHCISRSICVSMQSELFVLFTCPQSVMCSSPWHPHMCLTVRWTSTVCL